MATLEQLLAVLGRQVEVKGSELATQLRVSRPTVSRLLASAGPSVCRMGQGPATRYARTRSIASLGERVRMYRVDETGRPPRRRSMSGPMPLNTHWPTGTGWSRPPNSATRCAATAHDAGTHLPR